MVFLCLNSDYYLGGFVAEPKRLVIPYVSMNEVMLNYKGGTPASNVVVGHRRRHHKKLWFYGPGLLVLVAAISFTAWYVHQAKRPASPNTEQAVTTASNQLNQLQNEALYGDKAKALQDYDAAISATSDQTQKRNLLLDKAMTASKAGQYSSAIDAAQAADAIKSDYRSLAIIAMSYESQGNKTKAAEYYLKAANDPSDFNVDKAEYRQDAARLSSQP